MTPMVVCESCGEGEAELEVEFTDVTPDVTFLVCMWCAPREEQEGVIVRHLCINLPA